MRRRKLRSNYLQSDDILLLLFDKEGIEFLELVLQQLNEIDLLPRHHFLIAGGGDVRRCVSGGVDFWTFARPLAGAGAAGLVRLDELQLLLQLLVGEKLVSPFGQSLLNLVTEALPELHRLRLGVLHGDWER